MSSFRNTLHLFLTQEIKELIVKFTNQKVKSVNENKRKNNKDNWKAITMKELDVFIGIMIAMWEQIMTLVYRFMMFGQKILSFLNINIQVSCQDNECSRSFHVKDSTILLQGNNKIRTDWLPSVM